MPALLNRQPDIVSGARRSFMPPALPKPVDPEPAKISYLWQQVPSARFSADGVQLPMLDGATLRLPPMPVPLDAAATPDAAAVVDAAAQLALLTQEVAKVRSDASLTAEGKSRALAGAADVALLTVSTAMSRLLAFEADIDAREDKLTGAPPGPLDAVGAARASEIRQRLSAMPTGDAIDIVVKLVDEGRGEEAVAAVMHSPLPFAPAVERHISERWAAYRRATNPEIADSIKVARDSIDHSKRCLAIIGTTVAQLVTTYAGGSDLADRVLGMRPKVTDRELWPFGITGRQLEAAKLRRRAAEAAAMAAH